MIDYSQHLNPDGTWPEWLNEWNRCQKYIEDALEYGHGGFDISDVFVKVAQGEFHLWTRQNSAAVTEIVSFPKKQVVNIALAGGNLDELQDIAASVVEWAKYHGIASVFVSGRKGWQRTFLSDMGFKPRYYILELEN